MKFKSFIHAIKEALVGNEQDFSTGSLKKAIILLSIPMVLEMFMESVFAIVDILYVAHLGTDAVAAVGITESLMTIIYAIAIGICMGTNAVIARRIGEKKNRLASISAFQAILVTFFLSLLFAIPAIFYSEDILRLMGASSSVIEIGKDYTALVIGGNAIVMLLHVNNAIFRSAGDAALSLRVLFFANILNIILAPFLIFGWGPFPALGVTGAAVATTLCRFLGVVYQFYMLFGCKHRIKISRKEIVFFPSIMLRIIKLSLGGIFQNIVATSSWIFLMRIIADFGSSVVAGYTIAIRILIFVLLPSWGLSNAASTLVGQSLGARNPARAQKAAWNIGIINAALLGLIGFIFILWPEYFLRIFIDENAVIVSGAHALKIISYGFASYALSMVMVQALNGAGDTFTPMYINIFCFWLIEIPLAALLAYKYNMNEFGVYWAIFIAETLIAILALLVFLRGKWKTKNV